MKPLLILDIGGVLVDHDNALLSARLSCLLGADVNTLLPAFREAGVGKGLARAEDIYRDVATRLGAPVDVESFLSVWSSHFSGKPDMFAFADEWSQAAPLVLCSNTNAAHWDHLNALHRLDRWGPRILSHEVALEKPDPAIFRLAAQAHGARPGDCLFVDDQDSYLEGARAIGMQTHLFRGIGGLRAALAAA